MRTPFIAAAVVLCAAPVPALADDALPRFIVPGHERETALIERLFAIHHSPKTICTLWDPWLPMSTAWPAIGEPAGAHAMRAHYGASLLTRQIDADGYVTMNQHRGLAHPGGWPFPTWTQAGGVGWHFTLRGEPYRKMLKMPLATSLRGFETEGLADTKFDAEREGLYFRTEGPTTSITTPPVRLRSIVSPFFVIEWSSDRLPAGAKPTLWWTTADAPEFDARRSVDVPLESAAGAQYGSKLKLSIAKLHDHPEWKGTITRLRLRWSNGAPSQVTIRQLHSACDSRHPITNPNFVRGCYDHFRWTGNVEFLRKSIERMRTAIGFTIDEFGVRERGRVRVPWVGHDGRTGFDRGGPGGATRLHHGRGIGNNYYDLLPFGHDDAYATLYVYDALRVMARVERAIADHAEWNIAPPPLDRSSAALDELANDVKRRGGAFFWNDERKRFVGCVDINGNAHDYGFTFLNLEAVYHGFATDEQARHVFDWLDGKRLVEGDTSTGADIYRWRFGPRATTKRNTDWYMWVWHRPETIPWGGQVQDGGAVLGFAYYDVMSRLRTSGPDDAWRRLRAITDWFGEVEAEGGYRKYYAKPGRGTLQGGGTAGGLGFDHEFMESVMVPQVMLYGFLGFDPTLDGVRINPRLPKDWPSLTITRIALRDHVLDVSASRELIEFRIRRAGQAPLTIEPPRGWTIEGDEQPVDDRWTLNDLKTGATIRFVPR